MLKQSTSNRTRVLPFVGQCADIARGFFHLKLGKRDVLLFLLLLLVAGTTMFWRLGEGSLGDYDEADYAQSAREMLWWNDFNTPRWNGMEFFDKPPLAMWLTALAFKFFGVNEFGARCVSATSGVLVVLLVYLLGRAMFGRRSVGLGAAILLLTVSPNLSSHGYNLVSLARVGQLDMLLILLMTLSVTLVWRAQRHRKALLWLGVPLGLGLMTKSIAGFLAYGIVGLFFLTSSLLFVHANTPRPFWWRKETVGGILVSAAAALPWHLGQLLIWGRHFWNSYVVSLTVGYVTGDQGHTRDALFYLRSIQRGFPVLYPLLVLAVAYGVYRTWRHKDRATLLLLCWTAVPFVLYNLSRSKIGWYMIPTYPALALLTMNLMVSASSRLVAMCPVFKSGVPHRALRTGLALLVVVVATRSFNPLLPPAKDFNAGVKAVASYSRYVLGEDDIVVNYWPGSFWIRPSALFYAGRPLLLVTDEVELRRLSATQRELYVLTDRVYWEPLQNLGSVVYGSGGYVLTRMNSTSLTSDTSHHPPEVGSSQ